MKLKNDFITHQFGDEQVMVGTGNSGFAGIIRSNQTATFIVECLKTETSKEEIVKRMLEMYDVSEDVVSRDVEMILGKLRSVGALDE